MNATETHWLDVISSGKCLIPSGNKPLPEPLLTKIYVAIWRLYATMGYQPYDTPNQHTLHHFGAQRIPFTISMD